MSASRTVGLQVILSVTVSDVQCVWVSHTLNSSLKSLLSSAIRRFISSSSLSIGRGGYFLFVLGERANSGTLWSSGGKQKDRRGEEIRNDKRGAKEQKGTEKRERVREVEQYRARERKYILFDCAVYFNCSNRPPEVSVVQHRHMNGP